MQPKPYTINGDLQCHTPAVVKLRYGHVYVIVKCMRISQAMKNIENSVNAFARGGSNNPAGLYHHLLNYVAKHPDNDFKVETLLESDNAYLLLKREQEELDKGRKDPKFLNNQVTAYIPAYDEAKEAYGWIPKSAVLNFQRYLKQRPKPGKKVSV